MRARATLVTLPFDPAQALADFVAQAGAHANAVDGAIVSFVGLARGAGADGAPVARLRLDSYRGVTLASMQAIADAALARFSASRVAVVHRAGVIAPGEAIVFAAAAAPHRRAAYDAADYLMDRLKTDAVFWKCEEGLDGRHWIEPSADDVAARARWSD